VVNLPAVIRKIDKVQKNNDAWEFTLDGKTYNVNASQVSSVLKACLQKFDRSLEVFTGLDVQAQFYGDVVAYLTLPSSSLKVLARLDPSILQNKWEPRQVLQDIPLSISTPGYYESPPAEGIYDFHKVVKGRVIWTEQELALNKYDGDTLYVDGLGTVRLWGVDAPEIPRWDGSKWTGEEEPGGILARDYLHNLVAGKEVLVDIDTSIKFHSHLPGRDIYDRWLGVVYVRDHTGQWLNVNKALVANGYARVDIKLDDSGNLPMHFREQNFYAYVPRSLPEGYGWQEDQVALPNDDRDSVLGSIHLEDGSIDRRALRLGDVQFEIPPEEIQVIFRSTGEKIPLIRANSSIIRGSGHHDIMIQFPVYFTDLEQINGYPRQVKLPNGQTKTYHVNGLRALIAQFKRCPFLPVQNYYLNEILDIDAVTLAKLQVGTVEGYPGVLMAVLTVFAFDYTLYLPGVIDFNSVFNWPLFRFYYQRALEWQDDKHTYLAPITSLNNDFVFSIVSEEDLARKKRAEEYIASHKRPNLDTFLEEYEKSRREKGIGYERSVLEDYLTLRKAQEEWKDVKKQWDRYKVTGLPPDSPRYEKKEPWKYYRWDNKTGEEWLEITVTDNLTVKRLQESKYRSRVIPTRSTRWRATVKWRPPDMDGHSTVDTLIWQLIEQRASSNPDFKEFFDEAYEATVGEYEKWEEELKKNPEADAPMESWPIYGLHLTNLTASYQNIIVSLQPQLAETPTHQYMGSQDVVLNATFETTSEEAVWSLVTLMKRAAMLVREYHNQIGAGFLGFQHNLTQLLGVNYVVITQASINTASPNHYVINLMMVAYNRHQREAAMPQKFAEGITLTRLDPKYREQQFASYQQIAEGLKLVELYPDLELPTYRELYDAGFISDYKNKPLYVEPDFYITANVGNVGSLVAGLFERPLQGELKDGHGGKVTISNPVTSGGFIKTNSSLNFNEKAAEMMENGLNIYSEYEQSVTRINTQSNVFDYPAYEAPPPSWDMAGRPSFMSQQDWELVCYYANKYNTDPYLLAAIGWHETHWGQLGAGRSGYYFGVGVYDSGEIASQFRGLEKQLAWAARVAGILVGTRVTLEAIERMRVQPIPGLKDGVYASDPGWSWGVWNVYIGIVNGTLNTQVTPAQMRQAEVQWARSNVPKGPRVADEDDLFYRSTEDMRRYDRRGRLARAFPTFFMLLVDEGLSINTFKLFDNFYSYYAISRIEVHRSRKIAADTCIIEMVNPFGGLDTLPIRPEDKRPGPLGQFWDSIKSVIQAPIHKLEKERRETFDRLSLRPGARIHLRMGYGSDASELPVIMNGCITELATGEVMRIIAQSDAIELTNKIPWNDPESYDTSKISELFGHPKEPRDLLFSLLSSRGNIFKALINRIFPGLYNKSPLGIAHFGDLGDAKIGFWENPEENDAEIMQNVYAATPEPITQAFKEAEKGVPAPSPRKEDAGFWEMVFSKLPFLKKIKEAVLLHEAMHGVRSSAEELTNPAQEVKLQDEQNFHIKIFDRTTWDILQTLAAASPDFIATTHPFQFRSTIFFGKPYWDIIYDYEKVEFEGDKIKYWPKVKPFRQLHIYHSLCDIVNNKIVASERDIRTCVIGIYTVNKAGVEQQETTRPIFVDTNIYPEKQRTEYVDTSYYYGGIRAFENVPLLKYIPGFVNWLWRTFFVDRTEVARQIARSALRTFMQDMYKGELVVVGDPTVKPYDTFYLMDIYESMSGIADVKAVTHHFSLETGFLTSISPDTATAINDPRIVHFWSMFNNVATAVFLYIMAWGIARIFRYRGVTPLLNGAIWAAAGGVERLKNFLARPGVAAQLEKIGGSKLVSSLERLALQYNVPGRLAPLGKTAANVFREISKVAGGAALLATPAGWAALAIEFAAIYVVQRAVGDFLTGYLQDRQAIKLTVLRKYGKEFSAGINGHAGCVYGDNADTVYTILRDSKLARFIAQFGFGVDVDEILALRSGEPEAVLDTNDYYEEIRKALEDLATQDVLIKSASGAPVKGEPFRGVRPKQKDYIKDYIIDSSAVKQVLVPISSCGDINVSGGVSYPYLRAEAWETIKSVSNILHRQTGERLTITSAYRTWSENSWHRTGYAIDLANPDNFDLAIELLIQCGFFQIITARSDVVEKMKKKYPGVDIWSQSDHADHIHCVYPPKK